MNKFNRFEIEELVMLREFLRRCYKNRDVIEESNILDTWLFPDFKIYSQLYYDCEDELTARGIDIFEYRDDKRYDYFNSNGE
jgi:hypothetical protein